MKKDTITEDVVIDRKQLRTFGLMFGGIVAAIFGLGLPLLLGRPIPYWPWFVAGVMIGGALIYPPILIWVYKPWLKFGMIAGWINTRIILFLLFYVVITPTALMMRIFGADPLRKRFEPDVDSYRIVNEPQANDHMEKPY